MLRFFAFLASDAIAALRPAARPRLSRETRNQRGQRQLYPTKG